MNDIFEKFLCEYSLTSSSETMRSYRWNIKQFEKYLGDNNIELLKVIKDDVEKFLLQCSSLQLRKLRLRLLKKLYRYLKRTGVALFNPASNIKVRYKNKTKIPPVPGKMKVENLIRNINNVKNKTSVRNHLMAELAYGSGLRRGELMCLNIDDVNINEKTVCVSGKGNKFRMVPLTQRSIELLRRYLSLRENVLIGPLFLSEVTGSRLTNVGISKAFRNNIGIRSHLLRHACATHMLENGCDIRFIQELLGHKSLSVTQIYTQVSKFKLKKIVNKAHPRNYLNKKTIKEDGKSL